MTTPFATAMKDSMVRMSAGMHSAPVNGNPDHDFATMMIPHHRGGIDMAKAELQYGKDPAMRKIAQASSTINRVRSINYKRGLTEPQKPKASEVTVREI
jgi:uncharacterized protein (DUF305 family)